MGPTNTNTIPKKGIKIIIIAGAALIVIIIVIVLILSATNNSTPKTPSTTVIEETIVETPTVSATELKASFDSLAHTIISGETSSNKEIDTSIPIEEWQISKMSKENANTIKNTYAKTLLENTDSFYQTLQSYVNTSESSDDDRYISILEFFSQELNDELISSVLYLRAKSFLATLKTKVSQSNDAIEALINEELSIGNNISETTSKTIVDGLRVVYEETMSYLKTLLELGCINKNGKNNSTCSDGRDVKAQYTDNQELANLADYIYTKADEVDTYFQANLSIIHDLIRDYMMPTLEELVNE